MGIKQPLTKPREPVDLSFWRFVIFINFAKTWIWSDDYDDTRYTHIFTVRFVTKKHTGLQIIILPFWLMIGFS
jgi:hypothetical protein